jgi:hypothetical protein
MTKTYQINMLSKKKLFNSYIEMREFICGLPNHYCYVEVFVFDGDKKMLVVEALVHEIIEFLECNK